MFLTFLPLFHDLFMIEFDQSIMAEPLCRKVFFYLYFSSLFLISWFLSFLPNFVTFSGLHSGNKILWLFRKFFHAAGTLVESLPQYHLVPSCKWLQTISINFDEMLKDKEVDNRACKIMCAGTVYTVRYKWEGVGRKGGGFEGYSSLVHKLLACSSLSGLCHKTFISQFASLVTFESLFPAASFLSN